MKVLFGVVVAGPVGEPEGHRRVTFVSAHLQAEHSMRLLLVLALAACAGCSLEFVAPGSCLLPCARNSSGVKLLPVSISTQRQQDRKQLPVSIRSRCRQRRADLLQVADSTNDGNADEVEVINKKIASAEKEEADLEKEALEVENSIQHKTKYKYMTTTKEKVEERIRLLDHLKQLREDKKQFRDEKAVLLAKSSNDGASATMHAFWTNLDRAKLDEDGFLQLPEGTHFWVQTKEQRTDCMYVRQWYKGLYRHILRLETRSFVKGSEQAFEDAGYFDDEDCWFLADPGPKQCPRRDCAGITLAFMSPQTERYKEFMKTHMGRTAAAAFMPPWSLDELQLCRARMFPHLPSKEVEDLFSKWGGSARYVLEYATSQSQKRLLEAKWDKSLEPAILAAVFAKQGEVSGATDSVSDDVMQMVPLTFETYVPPFVSGYMFKLFHDRQQAALRVRVHQWLAAALGSGPLGTTPSNMFELLAHNDLLNPSLYNCTYNNAVLVQGQSKSARKCRPLLQAKLSLTSYEWLGDLATLKVTPDKYYWPLKHNFKAVDAFALVGDTLYMFQMTTTREHGAGAEGVIAVVNKVKECCPQLERWVLVFVVPDDMYTTYPWQKWQWPDKWPVKMKKTSPVVRKCEQWALQIVVASEPSSWVKPPSPPR
ncbi:hypothetical protein JKP88DRAFT_268568 [Tribonema minus]|uniref:Uncharacterized protein n=1 Tax=Tribonema minus TaxID=303371 RepID=A0A835YZG0_9STRA|nr:hypothetical protein JKP88DRAFT_268568 [Tribonema minus]